MSARETLDRAVSERDFSQQVVDLARLNGWLVYRVFDSRRSPEGWPDLCLVSEDGDMIVAELKTEQGRLSAAQHRWLGAFRRVRDEHGTPHVHIWRPSDWSAIVATLQRKRAA